METEEPNPLRVALIGYGYWGPNVARAIAAVNRVELSWILDVDDARRSEAKRAHPSTRVSDVVSDGILDDCDIVAIATPPGMHRSLTRQALEAGKHVFVEKPFTLSSSEAGELMQLASERGCHVNVDYTYVYSPEIAFLKNFIHGGNLGQLNYIDSVRVNLGLVQPGANVVWDLAVHDFAIMDFLFDARPISVSASGANHKGMNVLSAAFVVVKYDGGLILNLHSSWLSPVKVRTMMFSGTERAAIFDDVEPDLKVKLYDSAVVPPSDAATLKKFLVEYRLGDVRIPRLERWEPLKREWDDFIQRIYGSKNEFKQGIDPVRILRIAEAVDHSIRNGGREVDVAKNS